MVDLGLHLLELTALQVHHLEEIVGQRVDLVGHRGQGLGRVPVKKKKKKWTYYLCLMIIRCKFSVFPNSTNSVSPNFLGC